MLLYLGSFSKYIQQISIPPAEFFMLFFLAEMKF